jgi:peptidoglycan/LPS O-acetylase OafA/YrhL
MESKNRAYIAAIDYLRGISAIWVVGHHTLDLLPETFVNRNSSINPFVVFFNSGWMGVSIFMILSGYCLSLGTKECTISWSKFALSRFLRIAPMYYFVLIVSLMFGTVGFISFIGAMTFLPFSDAVVYRPIMWTVWSIRIEVLTYLFFPILWTLAKRKVDILKWLGLSIFLILLMQISTQSPELTLYWGLPGRLFEFSIGFYIGRVGIKYRSKITFWTSLIGLFFITPYIIRELGGFASLSQSAWYCVYSWNIVLIFCLVSNLGLWKKSSLFFPFELAGRYSYSIYLVHVAIIVVFGREILKLLVNYLNYTSSFILTSLFVMSLTFILSGILFELIEKPFLKIRPKYLTKITYLNK